MSDQLRDTTGSHDVIDKSSPVCGGQSGGETTGDELTFFMEESILGSQIGRLENSGGDRSVESNMIVKE